MTPNICSVIIFLLPKLCSKADTNWVRCITLFLYIYCTTFGIIFTTIYYITISYIICKSKEAHTKRAKHKGLAPCIYFLQTVTESKAPVKGLSKCKIYCISFHTIFVGLVEITRTC